jgi:hypothetical protein
MQGLPLLRLHFSRSPPLSLLSAAPRSGKGKNPRTAWLARGGLGPGSCRRVVKAARGQGCPGAPGLAAQAGLAMWPAPSGRHRASRVTGRGIWDFSPSRFPLGWATGARASSACVPAQRFSRGAVRRREAGSREKVWLVEKGSPTRGSHLSEIERVRGKVWFSWAKVDAWAGPMG